MPLSSSALCTEGRAGAVWAKDKSDSDKCASVSALAKNFPFHIHSQKESSRGTSLWNLSLNMIFPCVGKGNQSDLTGIEYFIVRQRGGEYLPRRFKKDLQLSLNMCACSYSEVLNCIITIETSTFTNVCDSNISTECKTVKLFRVVRVWICKQGFVYHLIAIHFLLIFM